MVDLSPHRAADPTRPKQRRENWSPFELVAIGGAGYLTYRDDGFPFRANATLKDFEGDIGHYAFHKYVSGYIICLHAGQHRERSSDMGRILALSPVKIKARH
jgi:hypothetical protein